ncbi:uncharacterized protein METZ01_LOCUS170727, partial [marine metagenome]
VQLLKENGIEPKIIEYLKTPLGINELKALSKMMGLRPKEFVRRNETEFKDNDLIQFLDNDNVLFQAMANYPKIMERPIIVRGNKAVIGRPPENGLTLLK